jgi:hypothetical protein
MFLSICGCCDDVSGVCNLRGFDAASGALLWEVRNFMPIGKNANGSVYGYRWTKRSQSFGYVTIRTIPISGSAASFSDSSRLQRKATSPFNTIPDGDVWEADCVRVDIDGSQTVLMSEVARTMVEPNYEDFAVDVNPSVTTGTFRNTSLASRQLHNCSNDGLILGTTTGSTSGQVAVEVTDAHKAVTSHQIRIYPRVLYQTSGGTAAWCLQSDGVTIKFGLYAEAADIETAITALTNVVSVSVTGGPACQERVDIEIEFADSSDQIDHMMVEYADQNPLSAASFSSQTNPQIWSLATHTPVAPQSLKSLHAVSSSFLLTFASENDGVIGRGPWGTSGKTAWSRLTWEMPTSGTVPFWGTLNTKEWEVLAFDGYTQTQERTTANASVSISREVSAVAYGKVAIASTSSRVPSVGDYETHVILDESDGSVLETGWSGMLNSTRVVFAEDGSLYWTGGRKTRFADGNSTTEYKETGYVESVGTEIDAEELRETDVLGTFGLGSAQVCVPSGYFNQTDTVTFLSPVATNNLWQKTNPWMVRSTTNVGSAWYYTFYHRDEFYFLSTTTRFSDATEWNLQHGKIVSGSFVAEKETDWLASDVSLASVRTIVEAWYGPRTATPSPSVEINIFGDDPFLDALSPPLHTWQKIQQITVTRDTDDTPNSPSPIVPNSNKVFRLQLRNATPIVTHPLAGLAPETGVIQWQRDVGLLMESDDPATFAPVLLANDTAVVWTGCRPVVDPDVFPRGDA